jgi:hypothetical protein
MKNKIIKASALVMGSALLVLFACEKKKVLNPLGTGPGKGGSGELYSTTTTGGSTTSPPLNLGIILGSSTNGTGAQPNLRKIMMLDGFTYAEGTPYVSNTISSNRFMCVGSGPNDVCYIMKDDGSATINFYYNGSSSYSGSLKLGSTGGADFLPDELEMTGDSPSQVYAIKDSKIYRIDNITSNAPYATQILDMSSTQQTHWRKTISPTTSSDTLKLFVAETNSAKGSTTSTIKVYNIMGITGTPSLSGLISSLSISYNNTYNLSSYNHNTISSPYHIVIGNSSVNTSATYQLSGLYVPSNPNTSISSFPIYTNDCSYLYP